MPHYKVSTADRADVARALIAAADDHVTEVRTSDSGFYVSEQLWEKAFPAADAAQSDGADDDQGDDTDTAADADQGASGAQATAPDAKQGPRTRKR